MKTIKIFLAIVILINLGGLVYSQHFTKSEKILMESKRNKIKRSKIKSKTLFMFEYRNNSLSKVGFKSLWENEQYDTNGNTIVEYLQNFSDGFIKINNKYDSMNRLLESVWCDTNDLNCTVKREYIYNDKIIIERSINQKDTLKVAVDVYEYDNNGNITMRIDSNENGVSRDIYKYDDKFNMISKTNIFSNNQSWNIFKNIGETRIRYVYDCKGNIMEMIPDAAGDSSNRKFKYKYDDKGNKIEEIDSSGSPKIFEILKYEYDEKGNLTKFYWDQGNGNILISIMKYDNNGNIIEKLNCDKNEKPASLYSYVYEYYE